MIDGDTIYTIKDCFKRNLKHRQKASALWVLDMLHVSSVQPYGGDAWFEVKDCSGDGSMAASNRRSLVKRYPGFFEDFQEDLRIEEPAALRWAFRRESHPLHALAVACVESINALSDYPLVDEMDHSDLEYTWASEAAEKAWEEAVESAICDETRELKQCYDSDDFNVSRLKDRWIEQAMKTEWHVASKDDVRFGAVQCDVELRHCIAKAVNNWRDEFALEEQEPDPVAATLAFERILEILDRKPASPAEAVEMWHRVASEMKEA